MLTGSLTAEVARIYAEGIVDAGKEPALFTLLAFLLTFAFVRTSTHLIRRGVKWWPGNLEVKGTHIHHLVWGILLLIVVGYLGVVLEPASPWHEVLAILFGVGAALTLDEFALWLNLRDVYWSHEGRRSIDAVIVASILGAVVVMGFSVWVDLADDVRLAAQVTAGAVGFLGLALALVNALKGKYVERLQRAGPGRAAVGARRPDARDPFACRGGEPPRPARLGAVVGRKVLVRALRRRGGDGGPGPARLGHRARVRRAARSRLIRGSAVSRR